VASQLLQSGFLRDRGCPASPEGFGAVADDVSASSALSCSWEELNSVRERFLAQLPLAQVLRVLRVDNSALTGLFEAGRAAMSEKLELDLWHGTTFERVPNIVRNGFNRSYSGRHGNRFGQGTYFSQEAEYSLRFCGRRQPGTTSRHVMLLSRVLVGASAKGSPDMVEPPFRDSSEAMRYDSTVDDVSAPKIFCVFRDYQAQPRYLIEFEVVNTPK